MTPTLTYLDLGKAGQVRAHHWEWKLTQDYEITQEFHGRYYSLVNRLGDWWIIAHVDCMWDFATWFPDFKWIIEASLGHDIAHWLIKRGIISERNNDTIDKEMAEIARVRGKANKFQCWLLIKGTNLVNQKADGKGRPLKRLYGNRGRY